MKGKAKWDAWNANKGACVAAGRVLEEQANAGVGEATGARLGWRHASMPCLLDAETNIRVFSRARGLMPCREEQGGGHAALR